MEIEVLRYNSEAEYTDGLFFIDCKFKCYTLEDEFRNEKVYAETRIDDGRYRIEFRTEGDFHARYLAKFGPDFHRGMLWIKDVPNFEYVLIHIGNDDDDTAGCLLVGSSNSNGSNFIGASEKAYKKFYPKIADALLNGECVEIEFVTIDDPNK